MHPIVPQGRPAGPPPRATVHRRSVARVLSWIALSLSLLIFAVAGVGYGAYQYYNARLTHVSIRLGGDRNTSDGPEQNFVIAGSDTRSFPGGQKFQGSGSDYVSGQRSDTVMLVHIPAGAAKVTIVSFPRDSYVTIPAYTDAHHLFHAAYPAKLNEAFAVGGPALLVKLIEDLTGLHVNHYIQVDFSGFQNMVNALGGLTLCVRTSRYDHDSGDHLTAGVHPDVDGATALAFVRDRKGLLGGDLDRIKDQQYFVSQLMKKVLSVGTLVNPLKVNAFLRAVTADVTVDDRFGVAQLQTLATRLRHLDPAHVTFVTIPYGDLGMRLIHGAYQSVVLLSPQRDAELFTALRSGVDLAGPARPSRALPPSQVVLSVRNGTSTAGLAARTATALRAEGFTVSGIGSVAAVPRTEVFYSPDLAGAARTVAAATAAHPVLDPTVTEVRLVLGPNFTGVRPVHARPVAAPVTRPGLAGAVTAATTSCAP